MEQPLYQQSKQISILFCRSDIEFLATLLEFDLNQFKKLQIKAFYNAQQKRFHQFASRHHDFSKRTLPSGSSLISEFEEEIKNWKLVKGTYQKILSKLKKGMQEGLENAA